MNAAASEGMPAYDYWLFDLDGTLVDTEWSYKREIFDRVGEELGRGFSDTETHALWHGLGGDRDENLRAMGVEPEPFWEVFDAHDEPLARAEATYLYDDAEPVKDIDAPVGVVTHCPEPVTQRVLDRLDLRDWFDTVVCCSHEIGFKPDARPVRRAVSALDAGGRGVLAGDGETDVGAARNAGLDAVHVERHDPHDRGHCVLGDHRVGSFEGVLGSG
jgi:phosphoglycolate phosphatase